MKNEMEIRRKKKSDLETNGNQQAKKALYPSTTSVRHIFSWQLDHPHLILPNVET